MANQVKVSIRIGKRPFKTYERALPESWEEVQGRKNRLKVLKCLLAKDPMIARLRVLRQLLKLPRLVFLSLDEYQVNDILPYIHWVEEKPLPIPLIQSFNHRGTKYFLPKAQFQNGACIEYPMADEFYLDFVQSGNPESLINLVATLCRPKRPEQREVLSSGDIRIPLKSRAEVLERAQRLKKMSPKKMMAVLLYFSGVKAYIHELYAGWIFPTKEEAEEGLEPKEENMFSWWGVYLDIAEAGTFGNYQSVLQTNFHTVCMFLVKKKKEADDQKRKAKNRVK
jgi:hypothetical protein